LLSAAPASAGSWQTFTMNSRWHCGNNWPLVDGLYTQTCVINTSDNRSAQAAVIMRNIGEETYVPLTTVALIAANGTASGSTLTLSECEVDRIRFIDRNQSLACFTRTFPASCKKVKGAGFIDEESIVRHDSPYHQMSC
jgi:hypothetical protein